MGSKRDDSASGGIKGSDQVGEPESTDVELVVELMEDQAALPGVGPNFVVGHSETIGGDGRRRSRAGGFRRSIRIAGVLAAAAVLAVVAWPTPKAHQPAPRPLPTHLAIRADLGKVRISGTALKPDDGTHNAVLLLNFANDAGSPLDIETADVVDATGARLGTTSTWPPGIIAADTSVSLPMTLPFTCFPVVPVLPITIRYSVSSPQDPSMQHDYVSPLVTDTWDRFTRRQAAHCAAGTNRIYPVSVDTTQSPRNNAGGPGFDLTFAFETAGTASWSVDGITSDAPGIEVSATNTPLALEPGQAGTVQIHVRFASCTSPHAWVADDGALRFNARMTDPGSDAGDQPFMKLMRSGLFASMVQKACQA